MPILSRIVGNCHVGESYLSVIRTVISKMREGHKTFKSLGPKSRRTILREIIKTHKRNRQLYQFVMTGYSV